MRNALILHGAGNNSQGNWFPWLKAELIKRNYEVWTPDLPDSDVPNKKLWLKTVFSNKDWQFNHHSVIIGHSAGATLILRILEKLPENIQIYKAILVAGPVKLGMEEEYFQYKKDLVKDPFDWKKIRESAEKFYFIHSYNDKYECGSENGEIMKKHLGGELIIKENQGHFNLEKGPEYKKFPLIIELLEKK